MTPRVRLSAAVGLAFFGALAGLYLGPQYPTCLGPLGVTMVQCVRAAGVVPASGGGSAVFGLSMLLAVLCLPSRPVATIARIAGGVTGAALAATAYGATRRTVMEGFDSAHNWLSIPLPLDRLELVAATLLGAAIGIVGVTLWLGIPRTRKL